MAIKFLHDVETDGELQGTSLDINGNASINAGVANINTGAALTISKGATPIATNIRYDTVVIEANDVATIRIGESDGTVSSIMSGDNNMRINSTDPIKFFTAGSTTGEAHGGQGGTLALTLDNSQNALFAGTVTGTTLTGTSLDINGAADISGDLTGCAYKGDVIASAYLDADTAHLSTTQTFTGAKTFTGTVALTGTGRITGIDTVSADTDAASKTYVDSAVSSAGGGDVTLSGSQAFTGAKTFGAATQFNNTVTVGADTSGHDVKFFGNATGEYMHWDESTSKLNIRHDTDDSGLTIFTVSSASMTQPQIRIGRDVNQYWGVYTEDRNAHLVHRQDETSGNMTTRFDQWDSNTSDTNGEWLWRVGNGTGGSMANVLRLTQAGVLTGTTFVGALTGNVTGNTSGSSGSCTGLAATATALATARNIGGVSFNGTAAINLPGVNTGGNQNTSGNAATVTTNANLTGHVTSSGNAAVLGSFTVAQLSAALSNASISGNNTGDQTSVSGASGSCEGNAGTATKISSITNSNIVQLAASQTLSNKTIAASQVTEISNITAAEGAQIENIGSTTISATQWGYLGAATGAITNTNTNLSTEAVQDIVGAMFSSNTETRVTATYQDGDGTIDIVVDDMTANTNTQLSNAQVRAATAAATDSQVFTDADHTKLNGIATSATADQTNVSGTAGSISGITNSNIVQLATTTTQTGTKTFSGVVDITNTTDSSNNSGDTGALRCEGGASIAKKLYVGSTITGSADVIAFSDRKLKENIETLDGKKVLDMRGVSFTRKDTGAESSGVIAQEIQKVAPELVHDTEGTLGVAYGNLVGYLIEAVKDQQKQIDELKELCNGCSR